MGKDNVFSKLFDKEILQKNLIFSSLYLMAYENFVCTWDDTILSFYANTYEFKNDEINYKFKRPAGKDLNGEWVTDKEAEARYKKEVYRSIKKNDGNYDRHLSMFNWLKKRNLILENDYNDLIEIRDLRNKIAHKLDDILNEGMPGDSNKLFERLMEIRKLANDRWFREVEIPTNALDFPLDENGNFVEPEFVISSQDVFFDIITKLALEE